MRRLAAASRDIDSCSTSHLVNSSISARFSSKQERSSGPLNWFVITRIINRAAPPSATLKRATPTPGLEVGAAF
jgi:hypothetical protein